MPRQSRDVVGVLSLCIPNEENNEKFFRACNYASYRTRTLLFFFYALLTAFKLENIRESLILNGDSSYLS